MEISLIIFGVWLIVTVVLVNLQELCMLPKPFRGWSSKDLALVWPLVVLISTLNTLVPLILLPVITISNCLGWVALIPSKIVYKIRQNKINKGE